MKPTTHPNLIAFDYYDGPVEGIAAELMEGEDGYFRVIAWDDRQDERLFVAAKIGSPSFSQVLTLLGQGRDMPATSTWLPTFASEADREMVAQLLEGWRKLACQSGVLLLTRSVGAKQASGQPVVKQLEKRVAAAMRRDTPEALGDWREYLPTKSSR
ncbi:hypothetical protein LVB87_03545 [Lysobacter sp. KIS68-7]|uniref:hypothetical protein n=1 Tax=Lysobacter sp. KIS68-7 TaxID=2904252 RepID=UPI001E4B5212|nr:hypothetical protein [Lysobacter sp. KIS68-7]UHQ20250.1 hypothetical protein LVB87_03545 [Lysobacter sp. KIS68-7]